MRLSQSAPWRYLLLLTSTWFGIFLLTRAVLLFSHQDEAGSSYLPTFGIGLLYDLSFLVYAAWPLGLYLCRCPPALWRTRVHRGFMQVVICFCVPTYQRTTDS